MKYKNYKINKEPILFVALFFSFLGVICSMVTKNWVWLPMAFIAGCVDIYLECRREIKQMEKKEFEEFHPEPTRLTDVNE